MLAQHQGADASTSARRTGQADVARPTPGAFRPGKPPHARLAAFAAALGVKLQAHPEGVSGYRREAFRGLDGMGAALKRVPASGQNDRPCYRSTLMGVYKALVTRVDEYGTCFPSLPRIERDTGYDRRTVCRAIRGLERARVVLIRRRFRRVDRDFEESRSNQYVVLLRPTSEIERLTQSSEPKANELEANELEANELEANELEANELEANEPPRPPAPRIDDLPLQVRVLVSPLNQLAVATGVQLEAAEVFRTARALRGPGSRAEKGELDGAALVATAAQTVLDVLRDAIAARLGNQPFGVPEITATFARFMRVARPVASGASTEADPVAAFVKAEAERERDIERAAEENRRRFDEADAARRRKRVPPS